MVELRDDRGESSWPPPGPLGSGHEAVAIIFAVPAAINAALLKWLEQGIAEFRQFARCRTATAGFRSDSEATYGLGDGDPAIDHRIGDLDR